jgi:hypothetical protein
MHALSLLLSATLAAGDGGVTAARAPVEGAPAAFSPRREARPPGNLLAGPARCVLRYLVAVRRAGPRPPASARRPVAREQDYAKAKALTAPRTLDEIARWSAAGADHPLAPWREAARARVLESFQLVAVRRAPHGAAVVTVNEDLWRPGAAELERRVSEYLVARVGGQWRVVDRSTGRGFDDHAVAERYQGFFDAPPDPR